MFEYMPVWCAGGSSSAPQNFAAPQRKSAAVDTAKRGSPPADRAWEQAQQQQPPPRPPPPPQHLHHQQHQRLDPFTMSYGRLKDLLVREEVIDARCPDSEIREHLASQVMWSGRGEGMGGYLLGCPSFLTRAPPWQLSSDNDVNPPPSSPSPYLLPHVLDALCLKRSTTRACSRCHSSIKWPGSATNST